MSESQSSMWKHRKPRSPLPRNPFCGKSGNFIVLFAILAEVFLFH